MSLWGPLGLLVWGLFLILFRVGFSDVKRDWSLYEFEYVKGVQFDLLVDEVGWVLVALAAYAFARCTAGRLQRLALFFLCGTSVGMSVVQLGSHVVDEFSFAHHLVSQTEPPLLIANGTLLLVGVGSTLYQAGAGRNAIAAVGRGVLAVGGLWLALRPIGVENVWLISGLGVAAWLFATAPLRGARVDGLQVGAGAFVGWRRTVVETTCAAAILVAALGTCEALRGIGIAIDAHRRDTRCIALARQDHAAIRSELPSFYDRLKLDNVGPIEYLQTGLCPRILGRRLLFVRRAHPLRSAVLYLALVRRGDDPAVMTRVGTELYSERDPAQRVLAMGLLETALERDPEQPFAPQILAYTYERMLEDSPGQPDLARRARAFAWQQSQRQSGVVGQAVASVGLVAANQLGDTSSRDRFAREFIELSRQRGRAISPTTLGWFVGRESLDAGIQQAFQVLDAGLADNVVHEHLLVELCRRGHCAAVIEALRRYPDNEHAAQTAAYLPEFVRRYEAGDDSLAKTFPPVPVPPNQLQGARLQQPQGL